ncbi:MAG: hypothetical protein JW781_03855 [Deltaproteobacteria bacterium]|nr:hypothetical protein [Candidatus Anaeroferrophillacea bacterium]
MPATSRMLIAVVLSFLLHTVVLAVLPDLSRLFAIRVLHRELLPEEQIEVTLLKHRPDTEPLRPPVAATGSPTAGPEIPVVALIEQRAADLLALGDVVAPPPPPVDLPAAGPPPAAGELAMPPLPATVPADRDLVSEFGTLYAGVPSGERLGIDDSLPPTAVHDDAPAERFFAAFHRRLDQADKPREVDRHLELAGPVAETRTVVYRPELPRVAVEQVAEVKLRFWVRPDGTVVRVEPVLIGSLSLMKAAELYLKAWRFNSLSAAVPQVDQWGTITIRFTID